MAYKASTGHDQGMSVDLETQIIEAGVDPCVHVTTPYWVGSVSFIVGELRAADFQVGFDPDMPENPYHGQIWGKFSRQKQRFLKETAKWYVPIPGVSLL